MHSHGRQGVGIDTSKDISEVAKDSKARGYDKEALVASFGKSNQRICT